MKIYVSSTYRDLREHRVALDRALRRMGHDVIGMEQYVAEGTKPLDRCLADVRACDAYVLILGWRYGYILPETGRSVTEEEFREAKSKGRPILAFLLDPEVAWPPSQVDALSADPTAAANISRFRSEVGAAYLVGVFTSAEDLASQAAAAVARQSLGQSMVERLLAQDSVNAADMNSFGIGSEINPSSMPAIVELVERSARVRALVLDLGNGDDWWSTRLYFLASLLRVLTNVRQIVFRSHGAFGGMASPAAILDGLGSVFRELDEFRRRLASPSTMGLPAGGDLPSEDMRREIQRQTSIWLSTFEANSRALAPQQFDEHAVKVGVRAELLQRWLGERLVDRCIQVDESGPLLSQVQQIVESLLPDLPIERRVSTPAGLRIDLQVICRDTFALALAREWVRSSLPRMPIR